MNLPKLLIDDTVQIGAMAVIGEDGFHFSRNKDNTLTFNEHKFGVIIHKNVWIGSHCSIDRGRWRDTEIGEGTKADNHVHISHNVVIGKNCIIGAGAILLGSVTIGDNCEIWAGSIIHQGVKIGNNCAVGANTYLRHDLHDNMVAYTDLPHPMLIPKSRTKKYGKHRGGVSSNKNILNKGCSPDTTW